MESIVARLCKVVLVGLAVASALCTPTMAETVAWYCFEEGKLDRLVTGIEPIRDSGPYGLHGTAPWESSVTYVGGIADAGELALDLNDRTDWVFVPDDPRLQLTESLTLEAYIRIRSYQMAGFGNFIVFRGDNRPGLDAYQLAIDPRTRELRFIVDGPGRSQGEPAADVRVPFEWLNHTIHVAGVLDDETGFMGLYVNGDLVNSTETKVRPRGKLHPAEHPGVGIGGFYAGNGSFSVDGVIDEVRISDAALKPHQFLCAAQPSLAWAGSEGFEEDGVSPDSGPPRTRFAFKVQYVGPDDPEPTVKLRLRRDGDPYRTVTMSETRVGRRRGGPCVFRCSVELGAGVWECQFEASGAAGRATGEPSKWHAGPKVEPPGRH